MRAILPVQSDGSEAEHSDRTEEPVQELDGSTEHWCVDPEAAARAGVQENVERHTHQAGADPRAGQVLNEASRDCLEDVGAAGTPQHGRIAYRRENREKRELKTEHNTTFCYSSFVGIEL